MQPWILVELVQEANIQTSIQRHVILAQPVMYALVRQRMEAEVLILADPHLLTITWVSNAPKVTIVQKDHTKQPSAHQALITLKKVKSLKHNVFCANLTLSRMNGARKAVKCAVSTLIRQKEPLFATVLERIELTLLETPRAAARVASTISMNQISLRVLSVTLQIVSH